MKIKESLYVVESRWLWGDYGSILISGLATRKGSENPLELSRTGPFVPPFSFPYNSLEGDRLAITSEIRSALESAPFLDLAFRRVKLVKVVPVPWHLWNVNANSPEVFPSGGEPENYLYQGQHDPAIAESMADVWEVFPPVVSLPIRRAKDSQGGYLDGFIAQPDREHYPPLFRSREKYGEFLADEFGRRWLEEHVGEWVRFCKVDIQSA